MGGDLAVAGEAERAEVVEIALAAAFRYGEDVVGVPEGAAGRDGLHAVERESGDAGFAAGSLERVVDGDGIGLAELADAAVAGEDLVAEVSGVGAETPLVDAEVGAEGTAAFGEDFQFAPAAERQAVGSGGELLALGTAAGEGARKRH